MQSSQVGGSIVSRNLGAVPSVTEIQQRDAESLTPHGENLPKMSCLASPQRNPVAEATDATNMSGEVNLNRQIELEAKNEIKYRTCSWKKTAILLIAEDIGIATMTFPWAYSVLGIVPGILLSFFVAAIVLYSSLIVWEFCLRYPGVKDVCDVAQMLFGGSKWIWRFTAVMLVVENTFVQALHCLVGAQYLNTVTNHAVCTVVFSIAVAMLGWLCTLPRTFNALSKLGVIASVATIISVLLAILFAATEDHPAHGWPKNGHTVEVLLFPASDTRFLLGTSALLNICYAFSTQIALPSVIAEMEEPKDFPKAIWIATICQAVVVSICGSVIYLYVGGNYMTSPAFASLNRTFELISYSFMVPAIIFLAVFHCSISGRFIFFNLFANSKHKNSNTVVGWTFWMAILAALWIGAFIIVEVVPFFTQMLSLITSLFEPYFGFFLWGIAYFRIRYAEHGANFWKVRGIYSVAGVIMNVAMILIGIGILTAGTYVSVQSIINEYNRDGFGGAFSCVSNGL